MEDKLRTYMDQLFKDVKPTRKSVELKEEILQNLVDKYRDLLAEGKTQEAAFNISVAGIGDMDELLADLEQEKGTERIATTKEMEAGRRKSALLISAAVMLYITCILPPILIRNSDFGAVGMFLMVAVATGLIIYNQLSKPHYRKSDDTIVEEFKEWQYENDSQQRACKSIISALWAIVVVVYVLVSFRTFAWHITWVIFLIGVAVEKIVKAVFELRR